MNALWFAFIIYILGMAVVLYFRPSFMFDGGAWKEFGLSSGNNTKHSNTTLFPFWMFVVVWSIVSYLGGTLVVVGFATISGDSTLVNVIPEETPNGNSSTADAATTEATEATGTAGTTEATGTAGATEATGATGTTDAADTSGTTGTVKEKPTPHMMFDEETTPEYDLLRPRRRRKAARPRKPLTGYYVKGIVNGKETYVYYGSQSPFDKK